MFQKQGWNVLETAYKTKDFLQYLLFIQVHKQCFGQYKVMLSKVTENLEQNWSCLHHIEDKFG